MERNVDTRRQVVTSCFSFLSTLSYLFIQYTYTYCIAYRTASHWTIFGAGSSGDRVSGLGSVLVEFFALFSVFFCIFSVFCLIQGSSFFLQQPSSRLTLTHGVDVKIAVKQCAGTLIRRAMVQAASISHTMDVSPLPPLLLACSLVSLSPTQCLHDRRNGIHPHDARTSIYHPSLSLSQGRDR